MSQKFDISIIIPAINEGPVIAGLIRTLKTQLGVHTEIILVDGGSDDNTRLMAISADPAVIILESVPGRCEQMNCGAKVAKGELLFFLHADSGFMDDLALFSAIEYLKKDGGGEVEKAGHCRLRFYRKNGGAGLLKLLEAKSRLNRKGCCHGDQGLLLPSWLFHELGGFNPVDGILAETRFADRLRQMGRLLLLPADILTSVRRFTVDGVLKRQVINGIIMTMYETGYGSFIDLEALYRRHDKDGAVGLRLVFTEVARRIGQLESAAQKFFWERVGGYICENGWQLAFWGDYLLNGWRNGMSTPLLKTYDLLFCRLVESRGAARVVAAICRGGMHLAAQVPKSYRGNHQ